MRLWHKSLIYVLPRQQLLGQWKECSAIAGNILTKGTPNHILVNKVMDYPMDHFITYAAHIRNEMTKRSYRTMDSVWNKIESLKPDWEYVGYLELYDQWMDNIYLNICYWNLCEKYNCGGMTADEWHKIDKSYYAIGNCPFTSCI